MKKVRKWYFYSFRFKLSYVVLEYKHKLLYKLSGTFLSGSLSVIYIYTILLSFLNQVVIL